MALSGDADQRVEECRELRDLDRLGVGGENDVLVAHLHPGGEEIASRIAKAHRIDDRHGRTVHFRAVDPKLLGELARLAPIEEYRARIGLEVEQPAGSRNRLGKRHPPGGRPVPALNWELALLARGAEGKEGLRLLVEIDGVARPGPDIVARLIDQRTERNRGPMAMALEHHPRVLALILEAAGPGDHVEQDVRPPAAPRCGPWGRLSWRCSPRR